MRNKKEIIRERTHNKIILLDEKNQAIEVNKKQFLKRYNVDDIIRIRKEDHVFLKEKMRFLTHFNLKDTNHKKSRIYALPLIVKPGYLKESKELLPILSFENCFIAECIGVRNDVSYEELTEENFKHSFPTIKNIKSLQEAILKRYGESLPDLTKQELISLGVGMTYLKIMGSVKKSGFNH